MGLDRLFSMFRISGSGLSAQRAFLEATASNIANVESTETDEGGPYIPRRVRFRQQNVGNLFKRLFGSEMSRQSMSVRESRAAFSAAVSMRRDEQAGGVEAIETEESVNPIKMVYEPDNPNADAEGYVRKPNINLVKEMTNMMLASRMYEANVTALNAAKAMMKKALDI